MAIARTQFTVTSTDEEYQVPGDFSSAQIVNNYSTQVPGLRNMVAEESVITVEGVGQVRNIVFKPRTGTKG